MSLSGGQMEDDSGLSTLSRHFRANITTKHTDVVLIICGFVGGLVDGLSFNAWGSFSSMQTGMYLSPIYLNIHLCALGTNSKCYR